MKGTLFVLRIQKAASTVMDGIIGQFESGYTGDRTPVFTPQNELFETVSRSMPCPDEGDQCQGKCSALVQLIKYGNPHVCTGEVCSSGGMAKAKVPFESPCV